MLRTRFLLNASATDHMMPNFWTASRDAEDVAARRQGGGSNDNFVDGQAESRDFKTLYDPAEPLDRWHPAPAR